MSNVIPFTPGGERPEHLRDVGVDEQTKKMAGGGGGLRISIKGGVFRMLNGKEELQRNEDRAMEVVIVRSSPAASRTFYDGAFTEGESKPPLCWSSDGVRPDAEVVSKQAVSCATCPKNVAGSGNNGTSRACRYSRKLAVVLRGDLSGKVFGLSLPATSIWGKAEANGFMPLELYAKHLTTHNTPASAVFTEMRFDTKSATPKLMFKATGWLSSDEYAIAKQQGETPEALNATQMTVFQQETGAPPAPLNLPGMSPVQAVQAVSGTDPNEVIRQLQAQLAAAQGKVVAGGQPAVVNSKATATAPPPASAASILSAWDSKSE